MKNTQVGFCSTINSLTVGERDENDTERTSSFENCEHTIHIICNSIVKLYIPLATALTYQNRGIYASTQKPGLVFEYNKNYFNNPAAKYDEPITIIWIKSIYITREGKRKGKKERKKIATRQKS